MPRPNKKNANTDDVEFPLGIYAKHPHDNAPDFIWAKVSLKIDDAIQFLEREKAEGNDWVNLDLQESKGEKLYFKVDRWKPSPDGGRPKSDGYDPNDDIPF